MVTRAPGVGAKLAERIVTELKTRRRPTLPPPRHLATARGLAARPDTDAVSALVNLGYRPPEPMRLGAALSAAGCRCADADPRRAEGIGAVRDERAVAADAPEKRGEMPSSFGRRRSPISSARRRRARTSRVHRGRARARRGARPCAVRRAARPRQDDAGADRGARAGRRLPRDLRPGHPKAGDLAALLTNLKSAMCCSSTRSIG